MLTVEGVRTLPLRHAKQVGPSSKVAPRLRNPIFLSVLFVLALLLAGIGGQSAFSTTYGNSPIASATEINGANVELNSVRMISGATLFAGDIVRLGAASSVALQFGGTLVLADSQTELIVESDGVNLRSGHIQIRTKGAKPFPVSGPYFRARVAPTGGAGGLADVHIDGPRAQISSIAGRADLTTSGISTPYELRAGEIVTLDAAASGTPPGQGVAAPTAGQVSSLQPQVQIERASERLAAVVSAPVYWNDDLLSGPVGRARITLTDGSLLNLGSNSSLRILQHDAQAQQTSLDLVMGRLRGTVIKLTRTGSKFEIRTPVGVAGLVGTDFSLEVTPDYVELIVFEGAVRFTISANGQAVTVTTGKKVRIYRTGALGGPQAAAPPEIQAAKDLTEVSSKVGQTATAGTTNSPLVPALIGVSGGVAALGIGIWQSNREPVSPMAP
jgi:ferric-dicitrate binding protein FerR (iron transport regulator)